MSVALERPTVSYPPRRRRCCSRGRCTTADLFDLEMIRVFGRSWVWLGDTEDLQEPGDFLTGTIGDQSVLVVRTADGEIKGFLNNCRHRASPVLLVEPATAGRR